MCPTENWLFASGSWGDDFEIVSGSLISSYIEVDRLKKTNVKKKHSGWQLWLAEQLWSIGLISLNVKVSVFALRKC